MAKLTDKKRAVAKRMGGKASQKGKQSLNPAPGYNGKNMGETMYLGKDEQQRP